MKGKCLLFIILIICCILSACSKSTAKDTNTTLKGRYVEKSIDLPDDIKDERIMLLKRDNQPVIYSLKEDPISIVGYQLNQDGTWSDVTSSWLKTLSSLPKGWSYELQLIMDGNGYEYLYYTELVNDQFKGALLCSKDGTTYETIKPEGWEEIDPSYGSYPTPAKVTILEDGTLAALMYSGEIVIYDPKEYKIQNTISEIRYNTYEGFLTSMGNHIILGESDDSGTIKAINIYNLDDYKNVSYPFEASITSSYTYCDINNQNVILCNAEGIFKMEKDTSVWNCVLDGSLTSLAMPTMWAIGFVSDASDHYYVLFSSDAGYSLKQYTFDPTADTLPSKELKIYALTDNDTLRQAIAVFQQMHQDIKVSFTVAMNKDDYASSDSTSKKDYIHALNTELLAGDSYDILVLDGLPANSFIEKGILADMSDILQPMIEDGTLLNNVMDSYFENGKCYSVPVRIDLNLLLGCSSDTEKLITLKALTDYAFAHKDTPVFGSFTVADLVDTLLPYQIKSLIDQDGKISRDNLIQVLTTLKQFSTSCGIVEKYVRSGNEDTAYGATNMWNLTKGDYFCLYCSKGFLDAMYPFGLLTYKKGAYISFENSFLPSCELGINSKGKQLELSKEFIRLILSEDIQKNDFNDGFPVNSKALLECSLQDRSDYGACTNIVNEDGTEEMLYFYPLDEQQTKEIVELCSSVSNRITSDDSIADAIKIKASDFFTGSLSASDAADAIIQELNIYLSE
jgi:ABC-type glycerol-3-phosphate transport system substrate-binding protein